ncbi:MAG: flagellin lysine-N-methylase [Oscillospiraceae bacterium]|nr:flagellin lysine-N-methylase [Oscillospiraceae bacterium]
MKLIVPDYYKDFRCIADACRHTCCVGWEIDIDEDSLKRFEQDAEICAHIDHSDIPHFRLLDGERCPFLNGDNLCDLILKHGEGILCQICRDHPRFRNFWADRVEMGLGLVCEEAARLILTAPTPLRLEILSDDGENTEQPEDEAWLMQVRERLLQTDLTGVEARLWEYLVYRHLADALYDDRLEARIAFIEHSHQQLMHAWQQTDGSIEALIEIVRVWSYDVEYDDEELERLLTLEEEKTEQP